MMTKHLVMIFSWFFDVQNEYLLNPERNRYEVKSLEIRSELVVGPSNVNIVDIKIIWRMVV
jgi:hypothetical protein